jgi:hypothetical protein
LAALPAAAVVYSGLRLQVLPALLVPLPQVRVPLLLVLVLLLLVLLPPLLLLALQPAAGS